MLGLLDRRGVAASELALLAPVLLALVASTYDVANVAIHSTRLEGAVRVGAQQALATPGDLNAVRAAIIAAAPDLTAANVPIPALSCECAGVVVTCGSTCASGEQRFLTLTAERTLSPMLIAQLNKATGNAVVRLQ